MSGPGVLVVEDNAVTRKLVRVILSGEGYRVLEAPDGRTALELAAAGVPDLVLQDLLLPDMDGFDLIGALRALPGAADMPIVAFSGFLSRSESARVLTLGFTDFLIKPVEPGRLIEVVHTYLGAPGDPAERRGAGRRVLVVDDDPIGLKLAQIHLRQAGFAVTGAADGVEALAHARASVPDAILSDVLMPRMDGFQLCLSVRQDPRLRHLPVVLCSANYVEEADRRLAARAGASGLTARTPDLSGAIRALLEALEIGRAPAPEEQPGLVESERIHRVVRQLERQVAMNAELLQRVSLQAAILSLVASLPGSLATSADIEAAPAEALASVLDVGGISAGSIYLLDGYSRLQLTAQAGFSGPGALAAQELFGHPELFDAAVSGQQSIVIPSPGVPREVEADLLVRAGLGMLVITPLTSRDERLGVLVLGAQRRDLTQSDWLAFARSIGSQLAHAMALSRAFGRLRASEARYRSLFDNMPVGLFRTTLDGRYLDANAALAERYGFPDRDAMVRSRAVDRYADPRTRDRLIEVLARDATVRGFEGEFRRVDGSTLWGRLSMRLVRDESGDPFYEGSLEDLSDRRRAEQRLAAEHAVTRALAESSSLAEAAPPVLEALCTHLEQDLGALWRVDEATGLLRSVAVWHRRDKGLEVFAGESGSMTFGSGVGLPGRVWATRAPLWIPDFAADPQLPRGPLAARAGLVGAFGFPIALGDDVLGAMEFFSREVRPPDEDLLRMLSSVGSQVGQALERWRVRAELDRQRESLIQTEKVAAMGQLLAGVAHELNNPLSVVLGQASLLSGQVAGGPHAERVKKIITAADRCARIVKNFLALARQRAPERRPVLVNEIVREAVELLAYSLRVDSISVTLDLADDVPLLRADPHQLHQVLVNLVTNAHHAMRQMPTPRHLTLTSRFDAGGGRVTIGVADTGPGIPEEIRARIFEPFFTTKPPGEGTGLGLSLCRGILEAHLGSLAVETSATGTVFRIALPAESGEVQEAPPIEALPAVAGARILVVDDETEVAALLAELLASEGHVVDTASNGRAALERLATGRYDLVVSDIRMPELDGPGLFRTVKARYPDLARRFVFLTGDTFGTDAAALIEGSGLPSLTKPFEFGDIVRVVRQVLGRATSA